ncbi:MAG: hypothetical protein ABSF26_13940 [Thermoguttaceae bacterium]|jgi:nucleoid-associated protein YgaU
MDPRVRILSATGVILAGLLLALAFRHPAGQVEPPAAGAAEALVVRKQAAPGLAPLVAPGEAPGGPGSRAAGPPPGGQHGPTVLTPLEAATAPPDLPKSYPTNCLPGTSRWGRSLGAMMPEPDRPPTARTHRIADGDSLVTLAERYLGSPDRALEIFEANRDVLSHPQLLPIGTELKIPPQNRPAGQP